MATLTPTPQVIAESTDNTFRTQLVGWYTEQSGNSAVAHLQLRVINDGPQFTGTNKSFKIRLGTDEYSQAWTDSPINSGQVYPLWERIATMTGGSSLQGYGEVWTYVYGTSSCSATLTMPTFGPSGLDVTNVVRGTHSLTATVSVTAWNGGSDSTRYRELSVCPTQDITTRKWVAARGSTLSSAITVDDDAPYQAGTPFTITPNTTYYLNAYATNGTVNTGQQWFGTQTTLTEKPTVTLTSQTSDSATFSYATNADGGVYNKIIEYSLDQGTSWNTIATVTGGGAASGTFTITGLTSGEHTIYVRSRTTAGSDGNVVIVWSSAGVNLIASDGTTGRRATRILVPVAGVATEGTRILVSHNGLATESA